MTVQMERGIAIPSLYCILRNSLLIVQLKDTTFINEISSVQSTSKRLSRCEWMNEYRWWHNQKIFWMNNLQ